MMPTKLTGKRMPRRALPRLAAQGYSSSRSSRPNTPAANLQLLLEEVPPLASNNNEKLRHFQNDYSTWISKWPGLQTSRGQAPQLPQQLDKISDLLAQTDSSGGLYTQAVVDIILHALYRGLPSAVNIVYYHLGSEVIDACAWAYCKTLPDANNNSKGGILGSSISSNVLKYPLAWLRSEMQGKMFAFGSLVAASQSAGHPLTAFTLDACLRVMIRWGAAAPSAVPRHPGSAETGAEGLVQNKKLTPTVKHMLRQYHSQLGRRLRVLQKMLPCDMRRLLQLPYIMVRADLVKVEMLVIMDCVVPC